MERNLSDFIFNKAEHSDNVDVKRVTLTYRNSQELIYDDLCFDNNQILTDFFTNL
jgi:hypothetical protein